MDKKFELLKKEMEKIKKESEEKLLKKQAELVALAEEVHSKAQAWHDCIIPYLEAFEFSEELGKEPPDFNQGRNCLFSFPQATDVCLRSSARNIYLDHVV